MDPQRNAAMTAHRAANSDWLENLARVGFIALGVLHVLIGWLALQLAWFGGGGESADQSGAFSAVKELPGGQILLWILGIGLFALALWQAAEVFRWWRGLSAGGDQRKRAITRIVKSVAKVIIYVSLGVLALRTASGSAQSSSQQQQQTTEGVFGMTGGRFLVGLAGLVIIGVGAYHIYKGWTKKFLEGVDLGQASPSARKTVTRLGQVGYPAKGVALGILGALLVWAAITFDPEKASGLDGALRTLLDAPFGKVLLTLVAVGLVAFGVFCFFRARYPERT
jgi:Domain of Unknown Function (DUF1206)